MTADVFESLAYLYDGTTEGLFSAIFATYANHQQPEELAPESSHRPRLGQTTLFIPTQEDHAFRVQKGLRRVAGWKAAQLILHGSLTDEPDSPTCIYRCVRLAMELDRHRPCSSCKRRNHCKGFQNKSERCPRIGQRLCRDSADPVIGRLHRLNRSVWNEREHVLQFARFEHLDSGLWFARINPKANVIPLAMNHFSARFNTQPFVLYDEVHQVAGVSNHGQWQLVNTSEWDQSTQSLGSLAPEEATMQQAWRAFYHAIGIESRYNPELRRHFMPMRFWRNLTEMKAPLPSTEPPLPSGADSDNPRLR